MGMRISTNLASINAQHSLGNSANAIQKSMAQMSSGSRITKSADDAAGLAISENLKSQLRSTTQATRNANDGISMIQTAEGGLNEISNIVVRMRELGIQASSDTVADKERMLINKEITQLKAESQRIVETTAFGTQKLINGEGANFDFQVGIHNDKFADRITYKASDVNASASNLGIDDFDFSTKEGAQGALTVIDEAQNMVAGYRANLGALQNRLESTINNSNAMFENLSAANSRIRDTDMAQVSSELARNNILQSASVSTLAQANQAPQMAMKLIG